MGVVYRVRDRERGIDIALKTLRGISPESVLRFKSEFRALRDVRDPNLVELGELFENEGTWFFTMELVRGVPFLEYVHARSEHNDTMRDPSSEVTAVDSPQVLRARQHATLPSNKLPGPQCDVPRLRTALAGLARGLSVLHAAGKVHRDVKPSNILVEDDGRVVLLDFGVVAELHEAFHEKLVIGTIKYMAPEQARGEAVGPAADWYSVGVLLFEALVGRLPFTGSAEDLLTLKEHMDAPAPSDLVQGVPADLDALARGLLARDPSDRPREVDIFDALAVDNDLAWAAGDRFFVGRAAELGLLDVALEASVTRPTKVIVEGESGVGKTALVSRFLEIAQGLDTRVVVLRGRCHERERVPFNALDGVIDDLTRFLRMQRDDRVDRLTPTEVGPLLAVFPALRTVRAFADAALLEPTKPDMRGRAFEALRDLLARLASWRKLIVAIDDLMWADRDSVAVLEDLFARDAPTLCLLATTRPRVGDAIVQRLGDVRTIKLTGLDAADTAELVRMVASDAAAKTAHIVAETRGHPLFIRELARQPTARPVALHDAIWTRAQQLDKVAQRLLAVVALAGAPIPRHVACTAARLSIAEAEPHIAVLARDHLVRVHGARPQDAIEPFHDRIREAVAEHQPRDREQELHRAIALALEAAGAPPAQLVASFDAAGDHARASQYVIAAAEAARAVFAFGRAAELFRRALEAPELEVTLRLWLLVQLAETLANDGKTAEAAERFLEGARLEAPGSERELDLLRRAAERFLMSGRLAPGLETARTVLARAHMRLPATRTRTLAGLLWNQFRMRKLDWSAARRSERSLDADICWSIGAGLAMVDSLLGAYFSGRAARIALADGNALQIARSMATSTVGAGLLGRRDRAVELMAATERAAREDGTPLAAWYVKLAQAGLSFILDNDFRRAHRDATALENEWYAAGHGQGWETDIAMHFSLASQQMLGEHREVAKRVAALVQSAKRNGDLFQEVTLRVRFAVRHLLDDRPDDARADVEGALAAWLPDSQSSFGNQHAWALWSQTRIALYAGDLDIDLDDAWQRMHTSLIGRMPVTRLEWFNVYGTYLLGKAIMAQRRGRTSNFAALCRQAERIADRIGRLAFPAAPASEAMLRAGIAWVRGEDLVAALRRAVDASVQHGVLAYEPFLRRRLGEAIGGSEGATLVAEADVEAKERGWRAPARGAEIAIPTGRFR